MAATVEGDSYFEKSAVQAYNDARKNGTSRDKPIAVYSDNGRYVIGNALFSDTYCVTEKMRSVIRSIFAYVAINH